jgi:enterochelin esterase-like enzyme
LKLVLLAVAVLFAPSISSRHPRDQDSSAKGDLELLQVTSKVFGNTRTVRVLLPPGYHDKQNSAMRYPVFYLNDGYAVFTYWNAGDTVHRLIREGAIEPLIVVGIDNAGEKERANEYLPYPDESLEPPLPHPQGRRYPQFLIDEVMPMINEHFRTKTGAPNTGLGGASYGAYIALYTVIKRPGVFGKLLLESTPLFIADFQILKDAETAKGLPSLISIEVGTNETPDSVINQRVGANAKKLEVAIHKSSPQVHTRVVLENNAEHNSEAWKGRLPNALKFLYGSSSK